MFCDYGAGLHSDNIFSAYRLKRARGQSVGLFFWFFQGKRKPLHRDCCTFVRALVEPICCWAFAGIICTTCEAQAFFVLGFPRRKSLLTCWYILPGTGTIYCTLRLLVEFYVAGRKLGVIVFVSSCRLSFWSASCSFVRINTSTRYCIFFLRYFPAPECIGDCPATAD